MEQHKELVNIAKFEEFILVSVKDLKIWTLLLYSLINSTWNPEFTLMREHVGMRCRYVRGIMDHKHNLKCEQKCIPLFRSNNNFTKQPANSIEKSPS
jgi:hypothetical protein